jgi:hypothetical protein
MKSQSVFKNVFLLVMASVLIYAFTEPYAPAPALKWDKMEFDFGEIQQGIPAEAVFNLTNVSQEPLIIKKVKGSCGCTATNYTQEPVSPGESGEISATYDAKNLGVFKKTVTVYTNFDEKPTVLTLSGKVVTP